MLHKLDIRKLAKARLEDAEALHEAGRYDGAVYLSGYAVEMALKARICDTLGWDGYPSTSGEFKGFASFKTHNFDILLRLSGYESKIKKRLMAAWSLAVEWDPEIRYKPIGNAGKKDASLMIESALKVTAGLLGGIQ